MKEKDREAVFAEEYLIDLNPYRAAIRAHYSPKTAKEAYRWLKAGDQREKPRLRARIEELMAERSRRTGVTADRVVRELARIGFADLTDVIDPNTTELREDAAEDDCAAIASIKLRRGDDYTEREIKLWDKNKALELLGRHLGLFTDNVKVSDGGVPQIIDDIPQAREDKEDQA